MHPTPWIHLYQFHFVEEHLHGIGLRTLWIYHMRPVQLDPNQSLVVPLVPLLSHFQWHPLKYQQSFEFSCFISYAYKFESDLKPFGIGSTLDYFQRNPTWVLSRELNYGISTTKSSLNAIIMYTILASDLPNFLKYQFPMISDGHFLGGKSIVSVEKHVYVFLLL